MASASSTASSPASSTASALDRVISHLEKTPYSHGYDVNNKYYLCRVLRTSGEFSDGVVCEPVLCLASNTDRAVHVNVWPVGFEATASGEWPPSFKMVPFQDFLEWNIPQPTTN